MTATVKEENGAGDVKGADAGALTAPEDKIAAQIQVSLEDGHAFNFVTKYLFLFITVLFFGLQSSKRQVHEGKDCREGRMG